MRGVKDATAAYREKRTRDGKERGGRISKKYGLSKYHTRYILYALIVSLFCWLAIVLI